MATGSSDNDDGSELFWPGYVDATTNLILNLLFLVTILIVAVFMFALELGRAIGPQDANAEAAAKVEEAAEVDPLAENVALKKEIARLNALIDDMNGSGAGAASHQAKALEGSSVVPKPESGLKQTLAGDFELTVLFKDGAVAFSEIEREKVLDELRQMSLGDRVLVFVEAPAGFSEAKRMGFYRALEVRNLLIELDVPTGNIDVSVVEGASGSDPSVVKVRTR